MIESRFSCPCGYCAHVYSSHLPTVRMGPRFVWFIGPQESHILSRSRVNQKKKDAHVTRSDCRALPRSFIGPSVLAPPCAPPLLLRTHSPVESRRCFGGILGTTHFVIPKGSRHHLEGIVLGAAV